MTLGVYVASIADFEEYAERDLNIDEGIVVTELVNGGAAQYAGIVPNDVITQVNDEAVKSAEDLVKIMSQYKVGDEVQITLVRNGKTEKITVHLKA